MNTYGPIFYRCVLASAMLVIYIASATGVAAAPPTFESVLRLPLKHYPDPESFESVTVSGFGSMVWHEGSVYVAYKADLFLVQDLKSNPTYEILDLPEYDGAPPDGSDYGLRLYVVSGELYLAMDHGSYFGDSPEEATPTLFRFDGAGAFQPVRDVFLEETDGQYSYGMWIQLVETAGGIAASVMDSTKRPLRPELRIAPEPAGPWGELRGPRANGEAYFLEDRVVFVSGTGANFKPYVLRGVLDESYTAWADPPSPLELYRSETLTGTWMSGMGVNPKTGTLVAGVGGGDPLRAIARSEDLGQTVEIVHATNFPAGHFAFPGEHARYAVAAGHLNRLRPQTARLAWSRDDGVTWESLEDAFPDDQRIYSRALFLEKSPEGAVFLGTVDPEGPALELLRLHLPDPAADAYPAAMHDAPGWRMSPTMGRLYTAWHPWTWIDDQATWVYTVESASGIWMWDTALEWLWSRESMYPLLYSLQHGGYLFYNRSTNSPRLYSDLLTRSPDCRVLSMI